MIAVSPTPYPEYRTTSPLLAAYTVLRVSLLADVAGTRAVTRRDAVVIDALLDRQMAAAAELLLALRSDDPSAALARLDFPSGGAS